MICSARQAVVGRGAAESVARASERGLGELRERKGRDRTCDVVASVARVERV